jgi:hypothetical protein
MEEYGIPLTEQDIKKPQPEKMAAIYERFVEDMMGVFREDLQQPQFGALDAFEQPELHEESVPQMLFYKALYVQWVPVTRMAWIRLYSHRKQYS